MIELYNGDKLGKIDQTQAKITPGGITSAIDYVKLTMDDIGSDRNDLKQRLTELLPQLSQLFPSDSAFGHADKIDVYPSPLRVLSLVTDLRDNPNMQLVYEVSSTNALREIREQIHILYTEGSIEGVVLASYKKGHIRQVQTITQIIFNQDGSPKNVVLERQEKSKVKLFGVARKLTSYVRKTTGWDTVDKQIPDSI